MGREIKKRITHGNMHGMLDIKYNIRTVKIHGMTHENECKEA